MQDITIADYAHAKGVCKDFEIRNVDKYHDLYAVLIRSCSIIFRYRISMTSSLKKEQSKTRFIN